MHCTYVCTEELEANINEHKRSAELLELQETLYWPSVMELNPEAYVCDSLKEELGRQPCCELLASKDRQLVDKGTLRLLDNKGRQTNELNVYLFTDILLLTEEHRPTKKEVGGLVDVIIQPIQSLIFLIIGAQPTRTIQSIWTSNVSE